jgi:hypothetical protein
MKQSINISSIKEMKKNGGSANALIVAIVQASQCRRDRSYILLIKPMVNNILIESVSK